MPVRDDRSDVKQTTAGFRDPRHHICQKQIPIPHICQKQIPIPKMIDTVFVTKAVDTKEDLARVVDMMKKDILFISYQEKI